VPGMGAPGAPPGLSVPPPPPGMPSMYYGSGSPPPPPPGEGPPPPVRFPLGLTRVQTRLLTRA
jgi:splicing factor 1